MGTYKQQAMGCGGSDDGREEIIIEGDGGDGGDGSDGGCDSQVVSVFVSADADSPNMRINMWVSDFMKIRHIKRKVNEVLSAADSWDGDGEFCDGGDRVWELDGLDWGSEVQMVAVTEGCDAGYWQGDGMFDCFDDWVVIDMLEPWGQDWGDEW